MLNVECSGCLALRKVDAETVLTARPSPIGQRLQTPSTPFNIQPSTLYQLRNYLFPFLLQRVSGHSAAGLIVPVVRVEGIALHTMKVCMYPRTVFIMDILRNIVR